jgi:hypothetical protein
MYRRLDERFRTGYCNLWAGLVSGNDAQALRGLRTLGLPDKYLDIMGLLLTYRIPFGVSFGKKLSSDVLLLVPFAETSSTIYIYNSQNKSFSLVL